MLHPGKVMFEGLNSNLIVYEDKGMPNQKFVYSDALKTW